MFVYIRSEPGLWTVGHYHPGTHAWVAESDHDSAWAAAQRAAYLNGGGRLSAAAPALLAALELVVRDAGDGGPSSDYVSGYTMRQVKAAIALARGPQPKE